MLERPYIVAGDSVFILLLLFALSLLSVIVYQSRRQIVHNLRYFFRRERKYAERGVVTKNFWLNTAVLIFISAFTVSLSVFDELVHRSGFSPTLNVPYWVGTRLYEAKLYLMTDELFAWTAVIVLVSVVFEKAVMAVLKRVTERN